MGRHFALAVAAGGLLGACEVPPTQLVVVVQTNMSSAELTDFRIRVLGPNLSPAEPDRTYPYAELPASFGVAPRDGDPRRRVEVQIDALRDGELLFTTRAATRFIEDHQLRLDLWLARRCVTEADECDAEETCGLDECEPVYRNPGTLEDFDGLDAGAPVGDPDAGAPECDAPASASWAETAIAFNEGLGTVAGLARDACGGVTIAGSYYPGGTLTWYGGADGSPLSQIAWMSSWARDGTLRFEDPLEPPDGSTFEPTALAADAGDIWMAAVFDGPFDLSAECSIGAEGGRGLAALRFSRDGSGCAWAESWPSNGNAAFTALAARDDSVLLAGYGSGLDFGLEAFAAGDRAFALVLRGGVAHCQAASEGVGLMRAYGADLGPAGELLVGGTYSSGVTGFAGHPLPTHDLNGFVAWLDAECAGGLAGNLDANVDSYRTPVAFATNGSAHALAGFNVRSGDTETDANLVRFDDVATANPEPFGSIAGDERLNDMVALPDGRVVLGGWLLGATDVHRPVDTGSAIFGFLLTIDETGSTGLTTIEPPPDSYAEILHVDLDPGTSHLFVVGATQTAIPLPGGDDVVPLREGHTNVFVARVAVPED